MSKNNATKPVLIRKMPENLHKVLKIMAAENRVSMQALIIELLIEITGQKLLPKKVWRNG